MNGRYRPTLGIICFNRQLYRRRNVIGRSVGWLKHCRNLTSRSDKLVLNFLAWIKLAIRHYLKKP